MVKDPQIAVQAALLATLQANSYVAENSIPVLDIAPIKGQPVPFITIGDITVVNDSTQGAAIQSLTLVVHTWDEGLSTLRLKTMMAAVVDALDDADLTLSGDFAHVSTTFLSSQVLADPDGVTKHGVQRFRICVTNA